MTAPIPAGSVEYLTHWLREHREESTEEALRGRLLEAGHPPADLETAFARLHAEGALLPDAAPPPDAGARRERRRPRLTRWGYLTWALVVWNTLMTLFVAWFLYSSETGGYAVVCEACSPSERWSMELAAGLALVFGRIFLVVLWVLGLLVLALVLALVWLKRRPTRHRKVEWALASLLVALIVLVGVIFLILFS